MSSGTDVGEYLGPPLPTSRESVPSLAGGTTRRAYWAIDLNVWARYVSSIPSFYLAIERGMREIGMDPTQVSSMRIRWPAYIPEGILTWCMQV